MASKENTIGRKIRNRRMELGLSQEALAEQMGISYQQVQKYEKGESELSVWRLKQMAKTLHVPVVFFFEDMPVVKEPAPVYGSLSTEEKRLLKTFRAVKSPAVRRAILQMIRTADKLTGK